MLKILTVQSDSVAEVQRRVRSFLLNDNEVIPVAQKLLGKDPSLDSKAVFSLYTPTDSRDFENKEMEGPLHHTAFRLVGDSADLEGYVSYFQSLGMTVNRRVTVDEAEIKRQLATKSAEMEKAGIREDEILPKLVQTTQGVQFVELSCGGQPPFIFVSAKSPKHLSPEGARAVKKIQGFLQTPSRLQSFLAETNQTSIEVFQREGQPLRLPLEKAELQALKEADGYIYWTQMNHLMTAMVKMMSRTYDEGQDTQRLFPLNHHAFRLNAVDTPHGLKTCDQVVGALRRADISINEKFGPDVQVHTEERVHPDGRHFDYTFKQTSRLSVDIPCVPSDAPQDHKREDEVAVPGNYTEWVEHPVDQLTGEDLQLEKFYGFLFLFMSTIKEMGDAKSSA